PVANQGRVVVYAVGGLEAVGGYVQDAGSTELRGGRLASVRGIEVRSGSLSGAGLISGSVTNAAVVRAGDPSGPLRVAGDFHQSAAGRLVMSALRTPASREQAPLEVWGEVFLEGTLKVTSPPGIAWEAGDRVALVTSDRLRGGLDQLELPPLPSGVHWEVEATAGAFHAVVAAGESEPRLSMVTAPGKPPRLRLSGALPLEVGVEVSTDLVTWTALPSRLEFSDDGVGVGGLPEFLSAESVFFRTVTRR
ncbi:MAG: hypothetical protein IT580_04230, partial [Verrucomicrobiales bacterium]|nr:hypothetical protein [Verrucomicrobiales bacterium]